jgi:hypothetical protein
LFNTLIGKYRLIIVTSCPEELLSSKIFTPASIISTAQSLHKLEMLFFVVVSAIFLAKITAADDVTKRGMGTGKLIQRVTGKTNFPLWQVRLCSSKYVVNAHKSE